MSVYAILQNQIKITEKNANSEITRIKESLNGKIITNPDNSKETISLSDGSDLDKAMSADGYKNSQITNYELQQIDLYTKIFDFLKENFIF